MLNFLSQIGGKKKQEKEYQPENSDEKDPTVKQPRAIKHKFIRDLNYKKSVIQRSERSKENLKRFQNQKNKLILKNTRNSSQDDMGSLLQNVVPGAKVVSAQWRDNRLNGCVQLLYDNGSSFKGMYQNGMRISGHMIYSQANCQYSGQYFGEKFSGNGTLTYYQGRCIQGQWEQSKIVGNASITYPNKDIYYGPVDDKFFKEGKGHLFFNNGNKYIGMFKGGSISGIGTYYQQDTPIARGLWQKGKLMKQLNLEDSFTQFSSIQNMSYEEFQRKKKQVPSISQMLSQNNWEYQPICKQEHLSSPQQLKVHNRKNTDIDNSLKRDSSDQINESSI